MKDCGLHPGLSPEQGTVTSWGHSDGLWGGQGTEMSGQSQQGTESAWKTEVAVLYKVIPEASSNQSPLSILLVRSMSQVLPKYKGRGNQEDTNSRERESPRTILEPAHMAFHFLCKRDSVM